MRLKRRKRFLDGWAVVDAEGVALLCDADGEPVLFRVPELAIAAGNDAQFECAWSVRWVK